MLIDVGVLRLYMQWYAQSVHEARSGDLAGYMGWDAYHYCHSARVIRGPRVVVAVPVDVAEIDGLDHSTRR